MAECLISTISFAPVVRKVVGAEYTELLLEEDDENGDGLYGSDGVKSLSNSGSCSSPLMKKLVLAISNLSTFKNISVIFVASSLSVSGTVSKRIATAVSNFCSLFRSDDPSESDDSPQ